MPNRGIRPEPQDEFGREGFFHQAKGYVTKDLGYSEYKRFPCKENV